MKSGKLNKRETHLDQKFWVTRKSFDKPRRNSEVRIKKNAPLHTIRREAIPKTDYILILRGLNSTPYNTLGNCEPKKDTHCYRLNPYKHLLCKYNPEMS
jgi:hypothetical protein